MTGRHSFLAPCRDCGARMMLGASGLVCEEGCGFIHPLNRADAAEFKRTWPERVQQQQPVGEFVPYKVD